MIEVKKMPLSETPFTNSLMKAYLNESAELQQFVADFPSLNKLLEISKTRVFDTASRNRLTKVIDQQWSGERSIAESIALDKLSQPNCVTVTTGHQLNILTGPLYTIFKIASVISLADQMSEAGQPCVPIFWLASEDHDFEEIDHTTVEGSPINWERETEGAVGRMSTTGFDGVMDELAEKISRFPFAAELLASFKRAYTGPTLGKASLQLYRELFGRFGLIVLDADHSELKKGFVALATKELEHNSTEEEVLKTSSKLENLGYHAQVHPRTINLFYLGEGVRQRIVNTGNGFSTTAKYKSWSQEEIKIELNAYPERFSPNALMRPMYQELILPNVAYVGGGGEISYWLQLKSAFDAHGIPFPMVIHRDSAMLIDGGAKKRWEKNELVAADFFQRKDVFLKQVVTENASFDMTKHHEKLALLFSELVNEAKAVDASLEGTVKGEFERQKKGLANLEGRFIKAEKNKQSTKLNQLDKLHETLLPGNKLQERVENFSPFYARHGKGLIDAIVANCNPLDKQFKLMFIQ